MKALLCRNFAPLDELTVEDVPDPVAAAGQVLVDVKAASVNYPDALMVQGKYQVRPPLPFVAGGELAGTVRAVGDGVKHLKPGMPVVALTMTGAFAEQAVADASLVLPLDPSVDLGSAAAMPMTYGTMHHALSDRACLRPGEALLVLGAGGGIGTAAVELGKIAGATVIAAASSPEKLAAAKQCGADHLIDYTKEDLRARLKEITGDKGVDVVCDPVGGSYTEAALRSTGWRGRYLVIGFAAGEIPKIPLNLALLKGCSIVGVFWGDFMRREPRKGAEQLMQLATWLREGRIHPLISARYPLAEGREALRQVFERRAVGKVLIVP
jgi:NADPH2:quinone reductase